LKEPKYHYSVDGQKFDSDVPSITGAEIRTKLSPDKRNYALYLEGQGNEPDRLIKDDTSVALEKHQQHRLYTVPPASFGGA